MNDEKECERLAKEIVENSKVESTNPDYLTLSERDLEINIALALTSYGKAMFEKGRKSGDYYEGLQEGSEIDRKEITLLKSRIAELENKIETLEFQNKHYLMSIKELDENKL